MTMEASQLLSDYHNSLSHDERSIVSKIKRFLESWSADAKMRVNIQAGLDDPALMDSVRSDYQIEIDLALLRPVIDPAFAHLRGKGDSQFPLASLWDRHIFVLLRHRKLVEDAGDTKGVNPKFDTWRKRQRLRCEGELSESAGSIVHPAFAVELSDGCSVGCWFCGISASKFKGHYPYATNAQLWRSVLSSLRTFFGPAAATGFCYWATDPCDNPDYPEFISDFQDVFGALPQTTTAAPLRDPALTRRILALNEPKLGTINRFSVLNRKSLDKIHSTFTAEELLTVELVVQASDSIILKAIAGRARERLSQRQAEMSEKHTTIACVTGLLVKMPAGIVQLVTPTRSTQETPDGYFILAEERFVDGQSFDAALRKLSETMIESIRMDDMLRFRDDLKVMVTDDEVTIADHRFRHSLREAFAPDLARLLIEGCEATELYDQLVAKDADIFSLVSLIDWMFENALLSEDPKKPGLGQNRKVAAAA